MNATVLPMKLPKVTRGTKPLPKNPAIERHKYTKLQAAEAQINTAIRLYFSDGHELAIHTLTRAAIGILEPACIAKGLGDLSLLDRIVDKYQAQWKVTLEEAQSFLKHGGRDLDAILEFWPDGNEVHLLLATEGYRLLNAPLSFEMLCYRRWFGIRRPDVLKAPIPPSEIETLQRIFPSTARAEFFNHCVVLENRKQGETE